MHKKKFKKFFGQGKHWQGLQIHNFHQLQQILAVAGWNHPYVHNAAPEEAPWPKNNTVWLSKPLLKHLTAYTFNFLNQLKKNLHQNFPRRSIFLLAGLC